MTLWIWFLADAAAGRGVGEGSVDAIWINGENFRTLSSQELTFGAFADRVPNAEFFHFDPENPASGPNLFDFGYPTGREEIPWSGDQYVCFIDTSRLSREEAPADFAELEAWLRENPGRFTYVRPPAVQRQHLRANRAVRPQSLTAPATNPSK